MGIDRLEAVAVHVAAAIWLAGAAREASSAADEAAAVATGELLRALGVATRAAVSLGARLETTRVALVGAWVPTRAVDDAVEAGQAVRAVWAVWAASTEAGVESASCPPWSARSQGALRWRCRWRRGG